MPTNTEAFFDNLIESTNRGQLLSDFQNYVSQGRTPPSQSFDLSLPPSFDLSSPMLQPIPERAFKAPQVQKPFIDTLSPTQRSTIATDPSLAGMNRALLSEGMDQALEDGDTRMFLLKHVQSGGTPQSGIDAIQDYAGGKVASKLQSSLSPSMTHEDALAKISSEISGLPLRVRTNVFNSLVPTIADYKTKAQVRLDKFSSQVGSFNEGTAEMNSKQLVRKFQNYLIEAKKLGETVLPETDKEIRAQINLVKEQERRDREASRAGAGAGKDKADSIKDYLAVLDKQYAQDEKRLSSILSVEKTKHPGARVLLSTIDKLNRQEGYPDPEDASPALKDAIGKVQKIEESILANPSSNPEIQYIQSNLAIIKSQKKRYADALGVLATNQVDTILPKRKRTGSMGKEAWR